MGINMDTDCVVDGDQQITCETAEGTGVGHAWRVEVAGQQSALYGAPGGACAGSGYAPPATFRYSVGAASLADAPDVQSFRTAGGHATSNWATR